VALALCFIFFRRVGIALRDSERLVDRSQGGIVPIVRHHRASIFFAEEAGTRLGIVLMRTWSAGARRRIPGVIFRLNRLVSGGFRQTA